MEYWVSKAGDRLILFSNLCHFYKNSSNSAKSSIPTFHYSIIPRQQANGIANLL